tara:strand:+ start:176 stop:490 length:315 start_codon:yes stop_codon:yes gene_type:complete
MTNETPMALLKEYFEHHGNDFECGTVYISREYADRDADIRRRIASMITKMESDRTSDHPANQLTFPRDSGTDILNNLDRRPTAIVDVWTENGRVEVIIRNEVTR